MPITFPFTLIAILFQVPICGLAREGMATVSQVQGQVTASSKQSWDLKAGSQLSSGTVVHTGTAGAVLIRPAPHINAALLPSSQARFAGSQIGADGAVASFELLEGTLFCRDQSTEDTLVQQIEKMVPGFTGGVTSQATTPTRPQQVLNPDFVTSDTDGTKPTASSDALR